MSTGEDGNQEVFRAVADPTRRGILRALRGGPRPVQDIVHLFSMSRPAISRHLRVLREAQLVQEKKQGRRRLYHLDARPLREMERWLQDYRSAWAKKS